VISRHSRTRRAAGLTAALCAAALTLTACGSDDSSSGKSSPSSSSTSPAVSASVTPSGSASASATPSASPTKAAKTITNLDAVSVTGNPGKSPTVKADWPIKIAKTTSKVLNPGTGRTVDSSATVNVNYVGINARTGKSFDSSFTRGKATSFSLDQVVAYDSQGGASQVGINKGDSLIFVVEIKDVAYKTAEGTAVTPPAGLPTVTVKNNVPDVKIGDAKKPSSLVTQPLIKGAGRKVTAKDTIQVKYRTWSWSDDELIEDGYDGSGVSGQMSGVIEGWKKGLVGQTVGSRVMLVVPPSMAYPKGNATPTIAKGETLVYVIDILFADEASS
jgi:peptidylprolyl isomerase